MTVKYQRSYDLDGSKDKEFREWRVTDSNGNILGYVTKHYGTSYDGGPWLWFVYDPFKAEQIPCNDLMSGIRMLKGGRHES